MALAVLAKGPIGLLLPGLIVAAYALLRRDVRALREALSPAGWLVFAAIAGPWYVLEYLAQRGAFLDVFFLNHNLERFTSTVHNHPGSILYYVPVLLGGLFPWSGLVLPALFSIRPRRSAADLFLCLWLLLPLLFFSAAGSKLPGYILPCLPPLAILAGRAADRLSRPDDSGAWRRPVALLGLVLGALVATGPLVLRAQGEPRWPSALPACLWALLVTLMVSRTIDRRPRAALALWRVGAAGLLLLVTLTAGDILAGRESGRDLFLPARGRPVLAWNAWRTAWMSGYFYNDGNVHEAGFGEVQQAAEHGPVLVLCGPGERRRIERMSGFTTTTLAVGARDNALLRVERRR
jgi:4-amino-4-deoxy-L-arabinose transferase-like glycosyltransferase